MTIRGGQPTLEQVAAVAGVSRATVSRVVNGSPRVSPSVRATVERTIADLGYVPNRAARSLVTRRTDTIALVISEPEDRFFADPFFATMIRGITAAVADTELQLLLLVAQGEREHAKTERYLVQGHVDGVLLMSLHGADPLPAALQRAGIPVVLNGRPPEGVEIPFVDTENVGGAQMAVSHLVALGRRTIATITGPQDMCAGVDRFVGYRQGLIDAGLEPRNSLVANGAFTEEGAFRAAGMLLSREPTIDGIFTASDAMAVGALRALRAAGRKVPDDVAVVGFDDLPLARDADPPLTTIHQPLDEMARAMADLLLQRIAGTASPQDHVVVPAAFIRRMSA